MHRLLFQFNAEELLLLRDEKYKENVSQMYPLINCYCNYCILFIFSSRVYQKRMMKTNLQNLLITALIVLL